MPDTAGERPRLVLAMLVIAYTLNFVDRQVISILGVPIKAELGLTDTELGLMGGVAFALFYAVLGIPLGRLADRTSRSGVITAAIAVWSGFTALCGLAPGFWALFLCRMGVGVGEAGGVAPSYALIADRYPAASRGRALAIFSFGSPIGSALGIAVGGYIAATVDWRTAFLVLGLIGVLFAPVFRMAVREPPRERPTGKPLPVWPQLRRNPTFWLLALGAGTTSIAGYGLLFWLPSFFSRSYGLELRAISGLYGALVLVCGVTGLWSGGWLADRLSRQSRRAYALVPAVALALAAPLYAAGILSSSLAVTVACFVVPNALGLMWLAPVTAAVQGIVPPEARGTASAVFLLVLNLIGFGGGALVLGALSDAFAGRLAVESLRYALLAGLGFYWIGAALFVAASRRLEHDWRT